METLALPCARLRAAADTGAPDESWRRSRLQKMLDWTVKNQTELCKAISEDFGHRSPHETRLAEVMVTARGLRYALEHLSEWIRPEPRSVHWSFLPGRTELRRQPKGVVGILAPWNYPFFLAFGPMTAAIAAGNRVMIKPSEYTPAFSTLLEKAVADCFSADEVAVVTGGPEVGDAFSRLPLDHLFFTGSTSVGRKVMMAAAERLTPVTLELGGKSPAIIHPQADLRHAISRIMVGKMLNAGQTCIAPDYVLLPGGNPETFARGFSEALARAYPSLQKNADYSNIINSRHHQRLNHLLDDAVRKGARLVPINPANETLDRKFVPTLVLGATDDMLVMQEEIFGPILPVLACPDVEAARRYVNEHPRPLALYYFDSDPTRIEAMLNGTTSGGVTINDTLLQIAQEDLPFGGIGPSGMGCYHGFEGFRTFSHEKAVFYQSRFSTLPLIAPPYGNLIERVLKLLIG